MNIPPQLPPVPDDLQRALDSALARALPPPKPSAQFQVRLRAALASARAAPPPSPGLRERLERDQRERLAALEADYLRLRRRTLGMLIGGAFAAGAAVALALPWLRSMLGAQAPLVLAGAGALVGLGIGAGYVLGWFGAADSSLNW